MYIALILFFILFITCYGTIYKTCARYSHESYANVGTL